MDCERQNHKSVVVTLSQKLYAIRLQEHLAHAKTLSNKGDYVQAGEKIWGALSALVNSRLIPEAKAVDHKKKRFLSLFNSYLMRTPNLRSQMRQLGLKNDDEVFHAIYGLHKFFYGGANYNNQYLSKIVPFLISLIEKL